MSSFKDVAAHLRSLFDASSLHGASFPLLTLPSTTVTLIEDHLAAISSQSTEQLSKKWTELLVELASKLPATSLQYPSTEAFIVLLDLLPSSTPPNWPEPAQDLLRHFWAKILLPLLDTPPLGQESFVAARRLLIRTVPADVSLVTSALWEAMNSSSTLAEEALRGWAKSQPREAFIQIARRADCRALAFLTHFMKDAPHLAHHAVSTPLLQTLARLVKEPRKRQTAQARRNTHDTADLACGAFALLVPRIPSLLDIPNGIGLSTLFAVFARAACWAHVSQDAIEPISGHCDPQTDAQSSSSGFIGPYAVDADQTPSPKSSDATEGVAAALGEALADLEDDEILVDFQKPLSNCGQLFTVLYGLWPCAFVEFLRAPGHAVEAIQWDGDVDVLHRRIQPFLKTHRLSPGLIRYVDASAERRDKARLTALEPADMLAEFQKNVLPSSVLLSAPSAVDPLDTRGRSRKPSLIPTGSGDGNDDNVALNTTAVDPHHAISETYIALKNKVARGVSVSSRQTTSVESGSGTSAAEFNDLVERLTRENVLLKNELSFELYLKTQHLQQLGTLHKEHVLESGLEAEVQALQTINRALRRKLEAATRKDELTREATAQRTANHVQFTDSLRDRSARYRDEKKTWIEDRSKMKASLEDRERRIERLAKELELTGEQLTDAQNELAALQPKLASISTLEQKNRDLTKSLLIWDDDLRRFRDQKRQMDVMTAEWQKMQMLQASGQAENDNLRQALRDTEEKVRKVQAELDATRRKTAAEQVMQDRSESSWRSRYRHVKEDLDRLRMENEECRARNVHLEQQLGAATTQNQVDKADSSVLDAAAMTVGSDGMPGHNGTHSASGSE